MIRGLRPQTYNPKPIKTPSQQPVNPEMTARSSDSSERSSSCCARWATSALPLPGLATGATGASGGGGNAQMFETPDLQPQKIKTPSQQPVNPEMTARSSDSSERSGSCCTRWATSALPLPGVATRDTGR